MAINTRKQVRIGGMNHTEHGKKDNCTINRVGALVSLKEQCSVLFVIINNHGYVSSIFLRITANSHQGESKLLRADYGTIYFKQKFMSYITQITIMTFENVGKVKVKICQNNEKDKQTILLTLVWRHFQASQSNGWHNSKAEKFRVRI